MSFARTVFATTARASLRTARANASSSVRIGARRMNSSHATPKSSDKPWIVVSALVFGPAFLYLASPSSRKSAHFSHNDAHDFPGHQEHKEHAAEEPEPVVMKDDEGTKADVTESVQKAEAEDAPKAADAEPSATTKSESTPTPQESTSAPQETEAPQDPDAKDGEKQAVEKAGDASGTFQESGDKSPTDQGEPRKAATEGKQPKEKAEESSS